MILTAIVALAYPVSIQYKQGGWRQIVAPLAVLTWLLDVIASYTEWWFIFGPPAKGDHTITARIRAMHNDPLPARQALAKAVQVYLDACEPDGVH